MNKVYGPYTRKDGRKHVILYDSATKSRTTVSYPKWLLQGHLGRELTGDETVDHIDGDFTNDAISNLQILSLADNARKSNPSTKVNVDCLNCGKTVKRRASFLAKLKFGACCSKRCNAIQGGLRIQQGLQNN